MKKNYLFAIIFSFALFTVNAQFIDDMESYAGGNTPILEGHWGSWDGTEALAIFSSSDQSQSGALSGYVDDSTVQDPILLLGDKIFGPWGLKFSLYIPSGKTGYFNLQGQEAPGIQWIVGNITFGLGQPEDDEMTGRIDWATYGDLTDDTLFQFPKDQWFDVIMDFDISSGTSAATWTMWVDGAEVVAPGTPLASKDDPPVYAQALGAVNIYSFAATNELYIDDINYMDSFFGPPLSVEDLNAKGFAAYPNPVTDVLNIKANEVISSVAIYNVLGQEIYRSNVDALNTTIDMSRFDNGAYFVKTVIGNTEGTVKVLK